MPNSCGEITREYTTALIYPAENKMPTRVTAREREREIAIKKQPESVITVSHLSG